MKLIDVTLGFVLSLGVLGAAQPPDNRTSMANDVTRQITTSGTAVPDNLFTLLASNEATSSTAQAPAITDDANSPDSPPPSPQKAAPAKNDLWRLSVTPYLWFPGVHGTIGALDRDANFRASAIDLLSHFR